MPFAAARRPSEASSIGWHDVVAKPSSSPIAWASGEMTEPGNSALAQRMRPAMISVAMFTSPVSTARQLVAGPVISPHGLTTPSVSSAWWEPTGTTRPDPKTQPNSAGGLAPLSTTR